MGNVKRFHLTVEGGRQSPLDLVQEAVAGQELAATGTGTASDGSPSRSTPLAYCVLVDVSGFASAALKARSPTQLGDSGAARLDLLFLHATVTGEAFAARRAALCVQ
jgi:hypothetical protein